MAILVDRVPCREPYCLRNSAGYRSVSAANGFHDWPNTEISLTSHTQHITVIALSKAKLSQFLLPPLTNKPASSPRSKSNSPASTKLSPTSSASRPTSSATKPPSSRPLSKASSPRNGASSIPMSNRPTSCWSGFWPSGARRRGRGSTRSRSGRIRAGCRNCRRGGCGRVWKEFSSNVVDCPHSTPKWTDKGKLCVRTSDFEPGRLNLSKARYVSDETFAIRNARLVPQEGDVLSSREGGILGIACEIPPGVQLCLGQRMLLIRPSDIVQTAWVMSWLNSQFILQRVKSLTGGSASPHLMWAISGLPRPAPPSRRTIPNRRRSRTPPLHRCRSRGRGRQQPAPRRPSAPVDPQESLFWSINCAIITNDEILL